MNIDSFDGGSGHVYQMAKFNAATSNLIDLNECMTECVLVKQWIRMFVHVYI